MSQCLRCGENEARICVPCANELAEQHQPSVEWNSVLEALSKLYEDWTRYSPDDTYAKERLAELMRLYNEWLE